MERIMASALDTAFGFLAAFSMFTLPLLDPAQ